MNSPLVSISCLVFNHEPFLRRCLDGFVMQETSFPFEVLIHEDCSSDGSAAIVREYADRYPDVFKPIIEEENQWVLGRRGSSEFNFPRAQGRYIALCEGDDYWTDPGKLQMQVDFLEGHPEYSMCFHSAENLFDDGSMSPFSVIGDRDYSSSDIMNDWIVPTASVMFRKDVVESEFFHEKVLGAHLMFGDTPLFLSCARFGKVRGMSKTMGVYRRHNGGVSRGFTLETYRKLIEYCDKIGEIFGLEKEASLAVTRNAVDGFCYSLKSEDEKVDLKLLLKAFESNPRYAFHLFWNRIK